MIISDRMVVQKMEFLSEWIHFADTLLAAAVGATPAEWLRDPHLHGGLVRQSSCYVDEVHRLGSASIAMGGQCGGATRSSTSSTASL